MTVYRYSARTHVGKVRKVNEDSILALPDLGVWAVSDGMGGHEAGDFASQTVTAAIAALPPEIGPADRMRGIREAILDAHSRIVAESHARGGTTIGATVVALIIANGFFACLWAGDSRLYRLRGGVLEALSRDHSLVADMVEAGMLAEAEAENHPHANVITRAVGVGDGLEVDKRRGEVRPGDRFLLCSDGLSRYADDATLARILSETPLESVADALIALALDAGGADNISVIVVEAPADLAPSVHDAAEEDTIPPGRVPLPAPDR